MNEENLQIDQNTNMQNHLRRSEWLTGILIELVYISKESQGWAKKGWPISKLELALNEQHRLGEEEAWALDLNFSIS